MHGLISWWLETTSRFRQRLICTLSSTLWRDYPIEIFIMKITMKQSGRPFAFHLKAPRAGIWKSEYQAYHVLLILMHYTICIISCRCLMRMWKFTWVPYETKRNWSTLATSLQKRCCVACIVDDWQLPVLVEYKMRHTKYVQWWGPWGEYSYMHNLGRFLKQFYEQKQIFKGSRRALNINWGCAVWCCMWSINIECSRPPRHIPSPHPLTPSQNNFEKPEISKLNLPGYYNWHFKFNFLHLF